MIQVIFEPRADLLEVALQFGMVMMFGCAFPPAFVFAALVSSGFLSERLGLLVL